MRVAATHADTWNGWLPTDPDGEHAERLLDLLSATCREIDRDAGTVGRCADLVIDPLDIRGARDRSIATMSRLADLGFDELRCYTLCESTQSARLEALEATAQLVTEV